MEIAIHLVPIKRTGPVVWPMGHAGIASTYCIGRHGVVKEFYSAPEFGRST
jgi:hypothetical protein